MGGGSTTTTVDNNNPYSRALARNVGASWDLLSPMIMSGLEGKVTPIAEQSAGARDQIMRHYAGRYGVPSDEVRGSLGKNWENLTKPNADWLQAVGGLYSAAGAPGPGGTTSTSQQNLGATDYISTAALIAALLG